MTDRPDVRNVASGQVNGFLLQAGSVGHVSVAAPPPAERPRQLPLAVRGFTGRARQLAALDALLADEGGPVVATVDGTAGVGKTALAVQWAHRAQHRFPDGTLYVDLGGCGPDEPIAPGDALGGFLAALGLPPERVPAGLGARAALYRSVLAGQRVLVVLDDAGSAEQVRPLLPGGAGCAVVVTSRATLTGLAVDAGATRIALDLPGPQEAAALVRAVLGPRADAEPDAVAGLVRGCARLPLALRVAASRAAARPHSTIADLVAELGSERGRWEALSVPADERTAVRSVFDWSYRRLTDEQARLFRRLGLHPGPEFGSHVAAAVADRDLAETRRLLDALADGNLVEPVAADRYRLHDLLRAYAADRAERDETRADRDHARIAALGWYAHHARTAYRAVAPELAEWHAAAGLNTSAHPEIAFPDPVRAWDWADREHVNAVAAARDCARHDLHRFVVLLANAAVVPLGQRGLKDDALEVCRLGLAAARRMGNRLAEHHMLLCLGHGYRLARRLPEAIGVLRTALALTEDRRMRSGVLADLGWMCVDAGWHAQAREHLASALPLSRELPDGGHLESFVEYNLGGAHLGLGEAARARGHLERCLALLRAAGRHDREAYALHRLAQVHQALGEHGEAIALCERALACEHPRFDPREHAVTLDTLAISLRHSGDSARAIACWREALTVFDQFADDRGGGVRDRLRAAVSG
ncbi:tetratricopeptide (TPR) repeat protein [Saccharothrix coeruleofusca]|uniref:ATP-binding protein n=1 Tax=Saccharothrix coeruleofusca TaxID=33919 RepID=UPI0027DD982D|nr:tetratricopeptide repeat protein [Saccharothrix coeruleofusca]MBP2337130.1 tetratricopeptide (TPR) repeat protein [Saccharothrix coeruleofusca]